LLKNHYQMFKIFNKDKVKLKLWTKNDANKNRKEFQTKQCLFFLYHPNGCLLNNESCQYKHSLS
jgi:hypothetical protein